MKIPQRKPETKKERIAAWRENIPDLFNGAYRKLYDKAMSGGSLRAAINSKCLDCMNWQAAEVKRCDIVTCPLHPYRPYKGDSERNRACGEADTENTDEIGVMGQSHGR
jgi:hypothetical protein